MGYMTDLSDLQDEVARWSKEKGWHDNWDLVHKLFLIHSEVTEAGEHYRKHEADEVWWVHTLGGGQEVNKTSPEHMEGCHRDCNPKPDGVPIEIADIFIRCLDLAALVGFSLRQMYRIKMEYNKARPYRHGGSRI